MSCSAIAGLRTGEVTVEGGGGGGGGKFSLKVSLRAGGATGFSSACCLSTLANGSETCGLGMERGVAADGEDAFAGATVEAVGPVPPFIKRAARLAITSRAPPSPAAASEAIINVTPVPQLVRRGCTANLVGDQVEEKMLFVIVFVVS